MTESTSSLGFGPPRRRWPFAAALALITVAWWVHTRRPATPTAADVSESGPGTGDLNRLYAEDRARWPDLVEAFVGFVVAATPAALAPAEPGEGVREAGSRLSRAFAGPWSDHDIYDALLRLTPSLAAFCEGHTCEPPHFAGAVRDLGNALGSVLAVDPDPETIRQTEELLAFDRERNDAAGIERVEVMLRHQRANGTRGLGIADILRDHVAVLRGAGQRVQSDRLALLVEALMNRPGRAVDGRRSRDIPATARPTPDRAAEARAGEDIAGEGVQREARSLDESRGTTPPARSHANVMAEAKNANVQVDFGSGLEWIQLRNGAYAGGENAIQIQEQLGAYGDLNGDGEEDFAIVLREFPDGGNTTYDTLCLLVAERGALRSFGAIALDPDNEDGLAINSLQIKDRVVILNGLVREVDDPKCCPSRKTERWYAITDDGMVAKVTHRAALNGGTRDPHVPQSKAEASVARNPTGSRPYDSSVSEPGAVEFGRPPVQPPTEPKGRVVCWHRSDGYPSIPGFTDCERIPENSRLVPLPPGYGLVPR